MINWKIALKSILYIVLCILIIFLLMTIGFLLFNGGFEYLRKIQYNLKDAASFGNILSGIFAGLAFIGVLATVLIQSKVLEKQESTADIQRFENTFFNMINLQQNIVNDLFLSYNDAWIKGKSVSADSEKLYRETRGRDLFRFLFLYVNIFSSAQITATSHKTVLRGMRELLNIGGIREYELNTSPSFFDNYFRHLYTIIKFVDQANFLSFDEKYKYVCIVRATLSPYELVWLFYNCLSEFGCKKFKPLVEKYSILKNIRRPLLARSYELEQERVSKGCTKIEDFPKDDYDFFSTNERGNPDKYYIGAFINRKDIDDKRCE